MSFQRSRDTNHRATFRRIHRYGSNGKDDRQLPPCERGPRRINRPGRRSANPARPRFLWAVCCGVVGFVAAVYIAVFLLVIIR